MIKPIMTLERPHNFKMQNYDNRTPGLICLLGNLPLKPELKTSKMIVFINPSFQIKSQLANKTALDLAFTGSQEETLLEFYIQSHFCTLY